MLKGRAVSGPVVLVEVGRAHDQEIRPPHRATFRVIQDHLGFNRDLHDVVEPA
jgi:hypothetical protein